MRRCTTRWPRRCRRISGPSVSPERRRLRVREASRSSIIRQERSRVSMSIRRRVRAYVLLLLAAASIAAPSAPAQAKSLTARDVIARIQAHVGVPWQQETVDTFKAGNPDTEVKGIAVTMLATLDVLQRAAAAGQNMIITHEPTFYNHQDKPVELEQKEDDPVLAAKRAFIAEHDLV